MTYRVAVLGTSQNVGSRAENVPRAYRHALGYDRLQSCELTCCADPDRTEAEAFADTYGIDAVYTEYDALLENESIDIVSICTPPATHAHVVFSCLRSGPIEAIHCETPVATRWVDCKAMVRECTARRIQLTFSFPRRFSRPVMEAKRLLESGAIGELRRLEWAASNLFTEGTHHFDLCDHLTGGSLPLWTLAGVDTDPDNRWDGALNEILGLAKWEYDDGVQGLASTAEGKRETMVDAYMRIVGYDGVIEIEPDEGPPLRIQTDTGWRTIDTGGETIYRESRQSASGLDPEGECRHVIP